MVEITSPITQLEAWLMISFLYVVALFFTTGSTVIICKQIDSNTINTTWLKSLPIIDYLMLGGAIILGITGSFVGYVEYNNPRKWSKLTILLITGFIVWILVTLISNAVFYDQIQDNVIDTSFKDFILVANAITFVISFLITSPLWIQAGGIVA
jgi:hypothetical protein